MRWRRERKPRLRFHSRLLSWWILLVGFNWNPWHWYQNAEGAAGGILGNIKNWVEGLILSAGNLLLNDIIDVANWVGDQFSNLGRFVGQQFYNIISWAAQQFHDLGKWINDQAWNIITWTAQQFRDLGKWVNDQAWNIISWTAQQFHDLGKWVNDEVWNLITWTGKQLQHIFDLSTQYARDLWNILWRDVIAPALAPLIWVKDHVMDIIHWWEHGALDLWHILEKGIGWLIWFAEHPIEAIDEIEHDITRGLRAGAPGAWSGGASRWMDRIVHAIGEWLGID